MAVIQNLAIGILVKAVDAVSAPFRLITGAAEKLRAGFAGTGSSASSLGNSLAMVKKLALGASAALAASGLVKIARDAVDAGDGIGEMSSQLGLSSKELQEYYHVGRMTGLSTEEMSTALGKLTVNLGKGTKETSEVLSRLGLSAFGLALHLGHCIRN